MSGGALNQAHLQVRDTIERMSRYRSFNPPLIRAFTEHLKLVAEALESLEWEAWERPKGGSGWEASVRAVLAPGAELDSAVALAKEAQADLARALAEAYTPHAGPKPEEKPK